MKYSRIRFSCFKLNQLKVPLLSLMFSLFTVSAQSTSANNQCFDPKLIENNQVPKCEATISFPDAAKPTGAVFISFTGRNPETPVVTYEAIQSLETKIKLNILTTPYELSQLESRKSFCTQANLTNANRLNTYSCRLIKILEDKENVNIIFLSQPRSERYVQDYLQFYQAGGATKLFPALNPYETTDFFDDNRNLLPKFSIANDVSKACGIEKTPLRIANAKGSSVSMGGNIESLPNGTIMLGLDDTFTATKSKSDKELFNQVRPLYPPKVEDHTIRKMISDARNSVSTFQEQNSLIKSFGLSISNLDTSKTQSGHADEVFSVVKSNARCGYTVLMPSTGLALKMLSYEDTPIKKEKCLITGTANSRTGFPQDLNALSEHKNSGCLGFRGQSYADLLQNADFISLNEDFEKIAQQNELLIRKSLKESCSSLDILKVPYLITKAPWGEQEMITPNAANALIITPIGERNSIYINNPTFFASFDTYISDELKKRQVESRLVYDDDYFGGFGGLHCGSSTIQICK